MISLRSNWLFLIIFLGFTALGMAQQALDTIFINNPSFEHSVGAFSVNGWTDCSFIGETPYDAQPGLFGCNMLPADGTGYIGMVVRDNESYEAISQRLMKPLQRGKCYAFSVKLAAAQEYTSQSRATGKVAFYVTPARIRIWGGDNPCQRKEMLAETNPISHHSWKEYSFKLRPIRNYQYIIIESFYKTPTLFPYNGNILVDDATNIFEMDCDDSPEELLALLDKPKKTPKPEPKPEPKKKINTKPTDTIAIPPVKHQEPTVKKIMPELSKKVRKGQIIRIRELAFEANSAVIPPACNAVLDELHSFLIENPTVKIELGGHTNNRCDTPYCNSLSEKRAKAVADALIKKGIAKKRIAYKGYGKTKPLATNSNLQGRKKNQRVEVKVITN